ncbi:hypothetical protein E2C01_046901 [Portunus trituberculatus]|uniref:Uncharacterized protein n=1 Tax=Portunus trituberculatus TaxID=210409 RepID=A0A5B7G7E0_PORTR|nr:hypothetical protein [Portunus trituberculatus]
MLLIIVYIVVMLTRYVPGNAQGISWSMIFCSSLIISSLALVVLAVNSFTGRRTTGATSYASLASRSSAESAGPKTTPSVPSGFLGADGPVVRLANRLSHLKDVTGILRTLPR